MEPTTDPAPADVRSAPRTWTAPFRDLVVLVLVLAGIFDGISDNPIHSLLLIGVAIALARADVLGLPERMPNPMPPEARAEAERGVVRLLAILVVVAFAVLVGGFGRYSWPATVAVVIPGAGALILSLRGPLRWHPDPGPIAPTGAVAWSSVFVGLGLWELTQLLLQPSLKTDSWAHPTISVMTDPALASHPGRTIALAVWLAVGWFLLTR
jgi:hypothetical protein